MKQVLNPVSGNFDFVIEPLKQKLTGLVKSAGTVASTDTVLEAFNKTAANVENLEAKNVRCTRFAIIGSGTSGIITIAAGNVVVLDDFGDGADAVSSEIGSDGRPSYISAQDANGTRVAVAFDIDGNYVLSHTPRAYPISVVYRTRISLKLWNESDADILGSYVETMPNHNNLFGLTGGTNINRSHYAQYATVAEAEAATNITPAAQCFVTETQKWYTYCATCNVTRDGGLVLNTGMGASTRWQAQIVSNKFGETGWINTDSFVLTALNTTTVRVTLSSVGTYALMSRRYEIGVGTYDVVISGVAGIKFIGINAAGALYFQDTLWNFDTQCPVAVVYWTGTAIAAAPQTEMHGLRDSVWHIYTHTYIGLQYRSGMTFTGSVQPDNNTNPGVDTVQYLWATDGVVQDEDIRATPGIGQWLQTLGSGLTNTTAGIFNFFYWNGAFITTANAMADRAPFIYTGVNGTPEWNNGGTLTPSVTGNYVVYHYFATPMVGGWAIFARPHNAVYASLAAASAARPSALVWSNYAEIKHLHTAIFRVNTTWTTVTHRCKLVSLQDFRTVLGGPVSSTAATDHNSLSNRAATLSHPASAIYGTIDGGVQFHDVASNGLLSSSDFTWNNTTKIMTVTGRGFIGADVRVGSGGGLLSTQPAQLGFFSGYSWEPSNFSLLATATSGGFIGIDFYAAGMAFSYDSGLTPGVTSANTAKIKMLVTNENVQFPQTTASTSTTTGCATFAGGVGIAGAVHIGGNFACNGVVAPARPTVNAACTDLATAVALINQLRAALVANGIVI